MADFFNDIGRERKLVAHPHPDIPLRARGGRLGHG